MEVHGLAAQEDRKRGRLGTFQHFVTDLHLHTVLSPCASREMLPTAIIKRALGLGLDLLAVTDHNCAENAQAMCEAGERVGIHVLPGMEVQTREEVHLVCLFDTVDQAWAWQEIVYSRLPDQKNDERFFGEQWIVDGQDRFVDDQERLLLVSAGIGVTEAVQQVTALGGLCIPAHVDRPAYSLIANLGFVPEDLDVVAVEISHRTTPAKALADFPQLAGYGFIASSDAHYLRDMQARNTMKMVEPTINEVRQALAGQNGREMWIDGLHV